MPTRRAAPQTTSSTTNRAALYLRVSTAGQAEREIPIAGQERACREFAERQGLTVVATYRDEGISGRTDQRPGFQEMVLAAKRREYDVLVVWEVSRLSRRAEHTLAYVGKLVNDYHVSVRAVTQDFLLDTSIGQLVLTIMAGVAAFESDMIGERTVRGMVESARRGRRPGGTAPFGYRSEGARLIVREDESGVIRQMWRWRVEDGATLEEIAQRLNESGRPTRRGNQWRANSVHQVVCNPAVVGRTVTHFYGHGDDREEIAMDDTHEPILTPDEFGRTGWNLDRPDYNRRRRPAEHGRRTPRSRQTKHLLTGLLHYADTGAPLVARGSTSETGRSYSYYGPQKGPGLRLRGDETDAKILDAVIEATLTSSAISEGLAWFRQQRQHRLVTMEDTLSELSRRHAGLTTQARNLAQIIADGSASPTVLAKLSEVEDELAYVAGEMARIQVEEVGEDIDSESDESRWADLCTNLREMLLASVEMQRDFIHRVVNKIDVHEDGSLTVHHSLLRPAESARGSSDIIDWLPIPLATRTFHLAA